MTESQIAKRYAKAFMNIIGSDVEEAQKQHEGLQTLADVFLNSTAKKFLFSPIVPSNLKIELLQNALTSTKKDYNLLKKFVEFTTSEGRVQLFPEICQWFKKLLNDQIGVLSATVKTATMLSQDQMNQLREQLKNKFHKNVEINQVEDKSLLGGFIVQLGNQTIDLTLKTKLERLAQHVVH